MVHHGFPSIWLSSFSPFRSGGPSNEHQQTQSQAKLKRFENHTATSRPNWRLGPPGYLALEQDATGFYPPSFSSISGNVGQTLPHICGRKGDCPKSFLVSNNSGNKVLEMIRELHPIPPKRCQDTSVQSHDSASQLCFHHHVNPSFSEKLLNFYIKVLPKKTVQK